jgi:large subunit ribosomal protein L20
MPRVKRGNKRLQRRKKILGLAKGFVMTKSKLYRAAKGQVERSLVYSYRDRRNRKRDFRRLWIIRINAGAKINNLSYSLFIQGLKRAGVLLNRKILADLALRDPKAFASLADTARGALSAA